jgi:hypothetical protein
VYSDRTRGELQVAKNNFFCSVSSLVLFVHYTAILVSNPCMKCFNFLKMDFQGNIL